MRNIFFLFCCAIIFASCSPKIVNTTKTVEKDSTVVDTVKTIKVVKTKGDSTGILFNLKDLKLTSGDLLLTPPSNEPAVIFKDDPIVFHKQVKTGRLTETVDVTKKGNIKVTCKEDSLQQVIDKLTITVQKFKTTTTTTQTTKIEHKATTFDIVCRTFTILFIILMLLLTVNRFKKIIPWIP